MATFLVFLLCIGGTFCICKLIILITYRKLCELALWLLDLGLFNDLFSDRLTGRDTVKSEVIEKKISDVRFIIGFTKLRFLQDLPDVGTKPDAEEQKNDDLDEIPHVLSERSIRGQYHT